MSARIPPGDYDEEGEMVWTPNIHGNNGSAHSISGDEKKQTRVERLWEVVAEVTNNRIQAPKRRGPGFF